MLEKIAVWGNKYPESCTPVCPTRENSTAPDWHSPSASCAMFLAPVQIAQLHELFLADIVHHVLLTHGRMNEEEWEQQQQQQQRNLNEKEQVVSNQGSAQLWTCSGRDSLTTNSRCKKGFTNTNCRKTSDSGGGCLSYGIIVALCQPAKVY